MPLRWLLGRAPALLRQWQQLHGAVPQDEVRHCAAMLAQLEQVCDRRLGSAGPNFTAAREALQALEVRGLDSDVQATALAMDQIALSNMQATAGGLIRNRQQALGELRRVAAYFRSAEPHSPVAYLAEQAARWGELPLHDWLKEVVKDSGQLAQLESLLGVAGTD